MKRWYATVQIVILALVFYSSGGASKLVLSHQTISPKSEVQSVEDQNSNNAPGKDGTWIWTATGVAVPIETRVELVTQAKDFVGLAFALGEAIPVGRGNPSDVSEFAERAIASLEFDNESLRLLGDLLGRVVLEPTEKDKSDLRAWVMKNIRLVPVPDDENGFLATQGVEGTAEHMAVVAYGGFHPYPGWEERLDADLVTRIHQGMVMRAQNESIPAGQLPGPPSSYLSATQVREFMKGGEEGLARFQDKLLHEIKDLLRAGVHKDESQEVTSRVNDYIAKNMQTIQEAKRKQKEKLAKQEAEKIVKLHVVANLSPWVKASIEQWRQIEQAIVDSMMSQAQQQGQVYGFNAFVFNQGQQVVIDFDHHQGRMNPDMYGVAHEALLAGLRKAQELGTLLPDGEKLLTLPAIEQKERLKWDSGENAMRLRNSGSPRSAEPAMTTQAIGLGMGAFNRPIWRLLEGNVGHLQSVGGEPGFRVVIANLNDIRQGKKQYRTHVIDIPGMHLDRLRKIYKKVQKGEMTAKDLKKELGKDLYMLLQLAGAQDEYAIEAVYAIPEGRFGRTMEDDEPIIKVHLHENPTLDFRMQSGAWATGTFRKVLSMPWIAANAKQTHWVGVFPVTLEEARDPSSIEDFRDWPTSEMRFFTSWAWTYDKGGAGRGEPPITDAYGVNDQTVITTRKTEEARFRQLLQNWQVIGDFEPRLTAEETIRRATEAAEKYPVSSGVHTTPVEGAWEPIPDLNKGERDPVVAPYQGEGHLTVSVFKADIGGKSGHDEALKTQMIAVTAKLEEAKQQGLINDYYVYFIADDIQFAILHEKGVHSEDIHQLAWNAFSFGYWVGLKLGLIPYGPGQDIAIAALWKQLPVEKHANVTRRSVELLGELFQGCAAGTEERLPTPTQKYKKNLELVSKAALEKFQLVEEALSRWEAGVGTWEGEVQTVEAGLPLNVTGMGIGWFEKPVEEEEEFMLYGLDKSGPGGKNARLINAVYEAIETGDLSGNDVVEIWDVEKHKRIFLRWKEYETDIRKMAAQVNKYNFRRFLDGGIFQNRILIFAWLSVEKLAHIAGKYVGKDDPISGFMKKIARHLEKQLRTIPVIAQLGDEAGSHELTNVLRAWWESTPGEKSNPVAVAINFKITDGRLVGEDVGSKPEFTEARLKAEEFNKQLVEIQGEFSPVVANRRQIEPTYSRAAILEEADRNPDAWLERPEDRLNTALKESNRWTHNENGLLEDL